MVKCSEKRADFVKKEKFVFEMDIFSFLRFGTFGRTFLTKNSSFVSSDFKFFKIFENSRI